MNDGTTTDTEPELTEQEREKLKARHDELSKDIRKTALVLLTYCFFCFLTLGQSDEVIVSATKMLKIPFANTEISPRTFLIVGPLILILLTAYLHVFIREHSKITALHPNDKLPYIFNLESWFTKALTVFTFYALPCIIMLAFAEKVFPRPDRENWFILAGLMCGSLLWIFILNRNLTSFKFWERINMLLATALIVFLGFIFRLIDNLLELFFSIVVLWGIYGVLILSGKMKSNIWKRTTGFLSGTIVLGGSIYILSFVFESGNNDAELVVWGAMFALITFWIVHWIICLFGRNFYIRWGLISGFSTTAVAAYIGTVIFYNVMIDSPVKLNLRDAQLIQADLRGYFLGRADLQGAHLNRAKLQGADLKRANLQKAHLNDANLQGTNLQGADLEGADLTGAQLQGAQLQGVDLVEIIRKGVDLTGVDLREAKLNDANLEGAKLKGADLRGAQLYLAQLYNANLRDVKFQGADLKGADFKNADLTGAHFERADLRGAKLKEAKLQGTYFERADLRGADFQGINLQGVNFTHVNLTGTDLTGADFTGADLTGAKLRGADLTGADLTGAYLSNAKLREVKLRRAKLKDAGLNASDLFFADFRETEGLTVGQVKQAKSWDSAFYDNGFRKKLGITDDQQRHLIKEYTQTKGHRRNPKQKLAPELLKFYGLAPALKP